MSTFYIFKHSIINFVYFQTFYYPFCTFSNILLVGPYHKPSCSQSMPKLHFSASFWFLWGCIGLYVSHLLPLFSSDIRFVLLENSLQNTSKHFSFISGDRIFSLHRLTRYQSIVSSDLFFFRVFLYQGSFPFRYSGMLASSKHVLRCWTSLSWMDVNL